MNMFKTLMFAFAVLFSGFTFATDTTTECPEGSEAPECQTPADDSGSTTN